MEEGLHHGDHPSRASQVCVYLSRIQKTLLSAMLQIYGIAPTQKASPTP